VRIILLGPAGAGKGTQAKIIAQRHDIPHLSSGELLREMARQETDLGEQIRSYLDDGKLVPDHILIRMIEEKIMSPECENGFILDGFIRTQPQAEAVDEMLKKDHMELDMVILLEVEEDALIERLSGRFTCETCGEGYHETFKLPKEPGVCDVCGGTSFSKRSDDTPEGIRRRLRDFHRQTAPIIPYFEQDGRLRRVDGLQPIEKVSEDIEDILSQIPG